MPLFRNTWDNQSDHGPETSPPSPPKRRTGLFGSRRSVDDAPTRRNDTYTNTITRYSPTSSSSSGGLFSRRRSSDDLSDRSLRRSDKPESSILAARQKVADAEKAERMASDALRQARNAAREATEQVRMLENEAREE